MGAATLESLYVAVLDSIFEPVPAKIRGSRTIFDPSISFAATPVAGTGGDAG
jgi:hypothetical protein